MVEEAYAEAELKSFQRQLAEAFPLRHFGYDSFVRFLVRKVRTARQDVLDAGSLADGIRYNRIGRLS